MPFVVVVISHTTTNYNTVVVSLCTKYFSVLLSVYECEPIVIFGVIMFFHGFLVSK